MNLRELSMVNVPIETARRQWRWLKWTTIGAMALSCAVALSLNLVDPDLWGHVKYGQDWLATGQLPQTATHTFTASDHPWINHENLAELALAEGVRLLGTNGLLAAKCFLGLVILASMVSIAGWRGVHPLVAWALMMLVARNLTAFFPMRPQLLSFVWCAVVLIALDRAFANWNDKLEIRWRWLWMVPILFALWANSHGGFVAGLCIVGALLGGRMIELALRRGRSSWRGQLQLVAVGIGCLAATLANPYGPALHRWLLESLSQPRPEITEWAAPHPGDPVFWPFLTLAAIAATSFASSRQRRDWTQIIILALVAWQASHHLRHIAFFALLCGYWLPVHMASALARLRPDRAKELPIITLPPWLRRVAVAALLVSISLQSFALAQRLTSFPVRRDRFPVDAVQFMADNHLSGKLVVCFNWAQYAIAALSPDVQVAFDGRFRTCYPQEVVDMHFDFLLGQFDGKRSRSEKSGSIDGTRVLEFGSPDLVLVDQQYKHAAGVMKSESLRDQPEWVLLYCDQTAELWGRRSRYNLASNPHYFPMASRVLDPQPRDGAVQWPALPERKTSSQLAVAEQEEPAGEDATSL